jgi:phosphoglycerate dehydrogenase-like enzyme
LGVLRRAGFDVDVLINPQFSLGQMTDEQVIEILKGAVAVIAWGEKYTKTVLSSLPELRVVARAGVGFDLVDIPTATQHNKVVTITPNSNYEAVAEHALALIFALAKIIVPGDRTMRTGQWPNGPRRPVREQTLGILGLGRIGRSLAVRALACRMIVVATETYPDRTFVEKHGIELADIDELLARSDFLSVNLPLSDATHGIINRLTLAKMKPGAALINTARGKLVVENDLVEALRSGHLGGAGLDVFEEEPTGRHNPLFDFDNVVVSPHIAGSDDKAMEDMGTEAAGYIIDLSHGKWPKEAVVNRELAGKWQW